MKKLFFVLSLIGICSLGYAQDVNVNINNSGYNDCPYRINGICASEDIGGVEINFTAKNFCHYLDLDNYNSFTVTVLWQLEYYNKAYEKDGRTTKTGSCVISANSNHRILICDGCYSNYIGCWSLKGLIVRKLAK